MRNRNLRTAGERGYTLLEYCAGAAIIAGVVYGSLNMFGGSLNNFFTGLQGWVNDRSTMLSSSNTTGGSNDGANNDGGSD